LKLRAANCQSFFTDKRLPDPLIAVIFAAKAATGRVEMHIRPPKCDLPRPQAIRTAAVVICGFMTPRRPGWNAPSPTVNRRFLPHVSGSLIPGVTPLQEACRTGIGDFRDGFRHAGSGLRRPQHYRA
jgi:hypothetical protein